MGLATLIKRIELSHGSRWINEDVRPVESKRRTWTFLTFQNYWLLINCNIATYLTGSALIPMGLTWWQALIAIIIGNILATAAIISCGMGNVGIAVCHLESNLPFPRYGFQAWVGGQCFYLILLSWDPKYEQHIPNTIPASTGMTSAQFLSYFIFCIVSLPALLIRPHRLDKFFYAASTITLVFFVVLLIWGLATMGPGGFGDTLSSNRTVPLTGGPNSIAWMMVSGIMSTIGSIAAGILNQNDYARLARRPSDAIWGQAFAYPLYSIFTSVIGILVTAATQKRLGGVPEWNPPTLFVRLLEIDNSPGTRAALFFAGLALVISQIGSSIPGNALSGGIDLASVFPRYINIRRGAYIIAAFSPIVNPWRLVNTATTFLTVLSSYGVFLAPMTGLMAAHYLLVARQKINIDHLYVGSDSSIYWYTWGINYRAFIAWLVGVIPCLPGFIAAVNTSVKVSDGATELYFLNYLYGFLSSGVVYTVLHFVFPASRVQEFVSSYVTSKEVRRYYEDKWETISPAQGLDISEYAYPASRVEESIKGAGTTAVAM
ncbi:hypothetical protein EYZ11_004692 [Aspergillus tanneri]|uniref:Thiamine transporter thi7 n=1 Tax=Aspergillus tanneri TaxID=1220188 RepID=A0A4S3JK66_9EURO|nr:hypothetical protein EYZ11_004692 [Aspergillus tanneri]